MTAETDAEKITDTEKIERLQALEDKQWALPRQKKADMLERKQL